jgi:imidazolonepropionase-like amidohydrolase
MVLVFRTGINRVPKTETVKTGTSPEAKRLYGWLYMLLLKNALLNNETAFDRYDILIDGQKIIKVAPELFVEKGETIIDLCEAYVLPGLIDCHTHLGIIEEATGKIGVDNNELSDPVTPHLRGIDAINPLDIGFQDAVKSGITTVMSGPGSENVVGGLNIAIKTIGRIIDQMVIKSPVGFKVAFGENPITAYGNDKKTPVTRMGTAALIRELFMRAQDYLDQKTQGKLSERNIRFESVVPVLLGKIPLRAHAHRADDIVTAIRIAEEFGIQKLVIEHGTEADLISDYLRERNIPVALGPMLTPRIKMELKRRNYGSALKLVEAGVKVALITDHPYNSIDQLRTIAALAVSEGLGPYAAIRCITRHPAEILGCENQIGTIKEGFDADLVAYSGKPLDLNSRVLMTIINGEVVFQKDKKLNKTAFEGSKIHN